MDRKVEAELLDELPPDDPRAARARRDLRRINAWMGNAWSMARALQAAFPQCPPHRLAEIGAGDGLFLLNVVRRLAAPAPGAGLTAVGDDLLPPVGDKQPLKEIRVCGERPHVAEVVVAGQAVADTDNVARVATSVADPTNTYGRLRRQR